MRALGHAPDTDPGTPEYDIPQMPGGDIVVRGDVEIAGQIFAVQGEVLNTMVSNNGGATSQTIGLSSTQTVASQGFTTGSSSDGYRLDGISVNISNAMNQIPDGPEAVSVAVHADSNGQPGGKLFDLVSPGQYRNGPMFFEAPPDAWLAPGTSYVMVWSHLSGTTHSLVRTASNNEDSGKLTGFSIANNFHHGADLDNLSSSSDSLKIVVYGDAVSDRPTGEMVSNLHQTNFNGYVQAGPTTLKVVSQGFTTGSRSAGYRLHGIHVSIEGSEDSDADAQVPDGASAVSVAVHADSNGKPGRKLFDLVSPTGYVRGGTQLLWGAAGHEAGAGHLLRGGLDPQQRHLSPAAAYREQ